MSKAPLSVIIPTYNEERNIEDCLRSVTWAQEIICVDGGSTDKTLAIVSHYTPHIVSTQNAPAETQRLKGLEKISYDWFLLLDADERVSDELRKEIEKTIRSKDSRSAYYVPRLNLFRNKPVHLHHPDYQLRLFKKAEIESLPNRIHRIPQPKGRTGFLKGTLNHLFFTSIEDYLAKLNKYTSIELSYWRDEGRHISGWRAIYYLTLRPTARFFQYYFLKRGFLDGFFGFFYSLSSAFYEMIVAVRFLLEIKESTKR